MVSCYGISCLAPLEEAVTITSSFQKPIIFNYFHTITIRITIAHSIHLKFQQHMVDVLEVHVIHGLVGQK